MKNNIIDLREHFVQEPKTKETEEFPIIGKLIHGMGQALEVAATAAITLCVCACTLLFFTML